MDHVTVKRQNLSHILFLLYNVSMNKRAISSRKSSAMPFTQLRVAAYCRVSTDSDEQEGSLESQIAYYTGLISKRPGWICAGIFSDTGSGRNTKGRPAFIKLMELCRKKRVDLILTKSISRFGRNTLDAIKAMRKLQALGVDVLFEAEGLRLLDKESQFILEIFSAFAQSESESKSKDIKWGLQRSYQDIDSKTSHLVCYGYKHDADGHLVVNEPEAETVRLIFQLRATGCSLRKVSVALEKRNILSPTGKARWSAATLDKLLSNEKYIGNVMLQKTFVEDFFSGAQVKNTGQRSRFLISNHHEAIVEKEIWDRVQEMKRKENMCNKSNGRET